MLMKVMFKYLLVYLEFLNLCVLKDKLYQIKG